MALVREAGFGAGRYGELSGRWDLVWDVVLGVPVPTGTGMPLGRGRPSWKQLMTGKKP